ncbi:DUF72 domain-containing protein [Streptomyces sp. B1866]|uniref:DUF72 domain-containing protein n=1 Tax=Streptomyces sp. B1866 TaxID=3075431 RepID=UPI002891D6E4|nr:DUF72 domain-containing protein [Streptomyces sp. B1866]MDT3396783.1 DUF72 domain-containing protein [Streptomyces sp. B1866]
MGRIMVGTCSWTDPALARAGWYPQQVRSAEDRLRYYAARFPVVEVDATYYALPSERNSRLWVRRTPPGFVFDVKAFSLLTRHPTRTSALPAALRPPGAPAMLHPHHLPPDAVAEVWDRFLGALRPLHDAGRLGAVLFQFPPWFRPGPEARRYVLECRERCAPYRVSVEFRHGAWFEDEARQRRTLDFLHRHDLPLVCVDMAQGHPTSVPPLAAATDKRLSVIRFHGRSNAWSDGDRVERYRYRYQPRELAPWAARARALAEEAEEVHVLFNNCCGDAAPSAAQTFTELLSGPRGELSG